MSYSAASPSSSSAPSPAPVPPSQSTQILLPTRTSCEQCRNRKVKCNGVPTSHGGCDRCKKDGVQCKYTVRAPIGRPKGTTGIKRRRLSNQSEQASEIGVAQVLHQQQQQPGSVPPLPPSPMTPSTSTTAGSPLVPYQYSPHSMTTSAPTQSYETLAPQYPPAPAPSAPTSLLHSSLATLEMAAFLDSLDRVEIRSSDGLTGDMLPNQQAWRRGSYDDQRRLSAAGVDAGIAAFPHNNIPSSTWGGSILDEGVSYAVPSDFSWWNVGLDGDLMAGDGKNGTSDINAASDYAYQMDGQASQMYSTATGSSTSASTADSSMTRDTSNDTGDIQDGPGTEGDAMPFDDIGPQQTASSSPRPGSPSPNRDWPRGPENGMGQGQITTQEGLVVTGGPWPSSADEDNKQGKAKAADRSCCSKKTKTKSVSPASSSELLSTKPCPRTGKPSCCCSDEQTNKDDHQASPAPPATTQSHTSPRVHCVPNPSGTGCTCLCESDVCLLRVRRTLSTSSTSSSSSSNSSPSLHLTLSASQAISASCACSSTCPTCRFHPSSSAFNASLLISLSLQIYARAVRILRDGFAEDGNGLEIKIGGYRPRKENARRIALLAMRLELTDLERGMGKVWSVAVGQQGPASANVKVEAEAEDEAQAAEKLRNVVVDHGGDGGLADALASPRSQPAVPASGPLSTKANSFRSHSRVKTADQAHAQAQAQSQGHQRDRRLAPIDRIVIRKLREQLKEMITRVEALENGE